MKNRFAGKLITSFSTLCFTSFDIIDEMWKHDLKPISMKLTNVHCPTLFRLKDGKCLLILGRNRIIGLHHEELIFANPKSFLLFCSHLLIFSQRDHQKIFCSQSRQTMITSIFPILSLQSCHLAAL